MAQRILSLNPQSVRQSYAQDLEIRQEPLTSTQLAELVYIFPNPPSAPPSPGQSSSPLRQSRDSVYSSLGAAGFSSGTSLSLDRWEWSEGSPTDDNPEQNQWIYPAPTRIQRDAQILSQALMGLTLRTRPLRDRLSRPSLRQPHRLSTNFSPRSFHTLSTSGSTSSSMRTSVHLASPIPHARIHIPFLSFMLSFLSVDDSTAHLLTHTSLHSLLFPGDEIMSDPHLLAAQRDEIVKSDTAPGILTPFLEFDEESSTYSKLREGHAVACDYENALIAPLLGFSLERLSNLWGFIHGFVKKKAQRSTVSDRKP